MQAIAPTYDQVAEMDAAVHERGEITYNPYNAATVLTLPEGVVKDTKLPTTAKYLYGVLRRMWDEDGGGDAKVTATLPDIQIAGGFHDRLEEITESLKHLVEEQLVRVEGPEGILWTFVLLKHPLISPFIFPESLGPGAPKDRKL